MLKDSAALELCLPHKKLCKLKGMLIEWQFKKVYLREQLESSLDHLNHACNVVKPGRTFIGRLMSLLTEAKKKHCSVIHVNIHARSDIRWWYAFIEPWNGISIIIRQVNTYILAQPIDSDCSACHWFPHTCRAHAMRIGAMQFFDHSCDLKPVRLSERTCPPKSLKHH